MTDILITLYFVSAVIVLNDRLILTPLLFNKSPLNKEAWLTAFGLAFIPIVNGMWTFWLLTTYALSFCLWFAYHVLGARP